MRTIQLDNAVTGLSLVARDGRIVGATEQESPDAGASVLLADGTHFVCHNFTAAAINRWVAGGEV